MGYCQVLKHIVFWLHRLLQRFCTVYLLTFLVLHVGTCVTIFQCNQISWDQTFYLCSSSLAKYHKINFRSSIQYRLIALFEHIYQVFCVFLICVLNEKKFNNEWKFDWESFWPHSPGCVSFGKNHILQVILQLIHLRVSQPVVVHEPLWRYQLIQIRSLLVLGGFIHQWFIVVYIWLGLSCIIDYKLGCLGRMFWHQLLRILYLMLERRCRKTFDCCYICCFFSFILGIQCSCHQLWSCIVQVPIFGVNSCSRNVHMLLVGLLELLFWRDGVHYFCAFYSSLNPIH